MFPSPHLKTEADPVSETLCFLVFRIQDDVCFLFCLILSPLVLLTYPIFVFLVYGNSGSSIGTERICGLDGRGIRQPFLTGTMFACTAVAVRFRGVTDPLTNGPLGLS
jgi:hypothetical protein